MSEEIEIEIDKLQKLIDRCNVCKFATCENCEINWTEVQAIQGLLDLYNKEKEENKKLKKYDYRNIKLEEKNKISSIHFTQEQLDLMNLGIALYVGIPKILADEKDEESDI